MPAARASSAVEFDVRVTIRRSERIMKWDIPDRFQHRPTLNTNALPVDKLSTPHAYQAGILWPSPGALPLRHGAHANWLPYVTGGLAAGDVHACDALIPASGNAFRVRWTAGAGIDSGRRSVQYPHPVNKKRPRSPSTTRHVSRPVANAPVSILTRFR
jgi:hypothetical protein